MPSRFKQFLLSAPGIAETLTFAVLYGIISPLRSMSILELSAVFVGLAVIFNVFRWAFEIKIGELSLSAEPEPESGPIRVDTPSDPIEPNRFTAPAMSSWQPIASIVTKPRDVDHLQQLGNGGDLVGLLGAFDLAQRQAVLPRPDGHRAMGQAVPAIIAATQ